MRWARLGTEHDGVATSRVRTVIDCARWLPFESVLRAIVMQLPEARFVPQVWVGEIGRPDLVDSHHRVVLEADSFGFHASREALKRDIERYNALTVQGWTVLRFSWEHVMGDPEYIHHTVRAVLRAAERSIGVGDGRPAA